LLFGPNPDDGRTRVRMDRTGAPLYEPAVRKTPVYCRLSTNDNPRTIFLYPLPSKTLGTCLQDFIDLSQKSHTPSHSKPEVNQHTGGKLSGANENDATNSDPTGSKAPVSTSPSQIHVLFRVSIDEDKLEETDFKDWLLGAPASARGVRILSIILSCSNLLLIRLPIEVWDLIPPSSAMGFIGWIRETPSENPPVSIHGKDRYQTFVTTSESKQQSQEDGGTTQASCEMLSGLKSRKRWQSDADDVQFDPERRSPRKQLGGKYSHRVY